MEGVPPEELDGGITALRFLRTRFTPQSEGKDGSFEIPISEGDPGLPPEARQFIEGLASAAAAALRMCAQLDLRSTDEAEVRAWVLRTLDSLIEAATLQALSGADSEEPPP